MSDVMTVSLNAAKDAVKHLSIGLNEVVVLEGAPGIGKTDGIRQAVSEVTSWPKWLLDKRPDLLTKPFKTHLLVDNFGNYQGVEINGYPAPDHERKLATWYMAETVPFKENPLFDQYNDHLIVWFIDEAYSCSPDMFLIMQQVALGRRIGKNDIRDNVVIVLATNREQDGCIVNPPPKAADGRWIRLNVEPDVDEWLQHMDGKLPDIAVAYHMFKKNMLCTFNPKNPARSSGSPRTWVRFWKIFAETSVPWAVREAGMYGAVGSAAAIDALTFVKLEASVPNLEDILKDPENYPLSNDLSVQYLTAIGIAGVMNKTNVSTFYKYLTRLPADLVIMCWKMACKKTKDLHKTSTWAQYVKDYLPAQVPDYK